MRTQRRLEADALTKLLASFLLLLQPVLLLLHLLYRQPFAGPINVVVWLAAKAP